MTDVFDAATRSRVMSRIRSRSGLDRKVHGWLCGAKIRHRMWPKVEGNPDVWLIDPDVYVFLDSCFWHRCPDHYREPKSTSTGVDWAAKIARNAERDAHRRRLPYRWIRIWEHRVRDGSFREAIWWA